MGFECQNPLVRKTKDTFELSVGVGTKGLGRGTFTHLKYGNDAIPKSACPEAELAFPSKEPGGPPVRIKTVLKERC